MKINIGDIRVKERIRKQMNKVTELAEDMNRNGLISPIAVMSADDGGYLLLVGLRRIRAAQSLDWTEIEANVISPKDAEEALRIEISENEQREAFTSEEKLDYGRQLERLETAKALKRKSMGGQGGIKEDRDLGPYLPEGSSDGRVRDIIGEKLGLSGRQYDRLKYIEKNAPSEVLREIDSGERSIRGTYDELQAKSKAASGPSVSNLPVREQAKESTLEAFAVKDGSDDAALSIAKSQASPVPKTTSPTPKSTPPALKSTKPHKSPKLSDKEKSERAMAMFSPKEREAIERNNAFATMTAEEKVVELQRQLKEERTGRAVAESELSRLRDELHNAVMHRDGIINSLNRENDRLKALLSEANAKIAELEGNVNVTSA